MPPRKKDVCFKQRNGMMVAFGARKTKAPCTNQDLSRLVKKRVQKKELDALMKLSRGLAFTPPILGYSKAGRAYHVYMKRTGISLNLEPNGGQKTKADARFRPWLVRAITYLKSKGIRHDDLKRGAKRNITVRVSPQTQVRYYHLIDFGKITLTARYNVQTQVAEIMRHL